MNRTVVAPLNTGCDVLRSRHVFGWLRLQTSMGKEGRLRLHAKKGGSRRALAPEPDVDGMELANVILLKH